MRPSIPRFVTVRRPSQQHRTKMPVWLRDRVKLAEKKEAEYLVRVEEAKAKGEPIPRFREPVVPRDLKWYAVARSENGNLPVYTEFRGDGGCSTVLRKIQGDVTSCQKELNAYFLNVHIDPVKDAPQAIQKQTSKQLVFKGNMRKDLEDWLTQKGF